VSTVTPDQAIVIPVGGDAANNPTAFVNMIAGVESRLVLRYANLAGRTALHTSPVENDVTALAAEDRIDAYDGASYVSLTSRGRYARRMRTTNATPIISNTTLVADAVLLVTLDVTGTFSIRGRLYYDASTAGDVRMALNFPAVTAAKWGLLGRNATTQTNIDAITATASASPLQAGGNGVGTETFFDFEGFITTTATGTLQVSYAQGTSDATNLTIRSGSFLEVIKES